MSDQSASARRQEVMRALDSIHDPCSVSVGHPIGLVGMGIIDAIEMHEGDVAVMVLPTFPDCLFRGVFEERIEQAIGALPWCRSVTVAFRPADCGWDESRMSSDALRRLGHRRTIHTAKRS